jgi:RNA polymerase sigma-70 factor (ECF subfamily)
MHDAQSSKVNEFMAKLAAHQRRLYQYIFALLPRHHDADDVMQNTLVVLWEKFGEFDPATSFYAWARRIAYLQAQNYRRQSTRMAAVLDETAFEQIAARIESYSDVLQARQDAMTRCAEKLGAADRLLLNLRYRPGATVKDIARQLGRPANSVCKSLGRIRRALWDCISAEMAAGESKRAEEDEP